MNRVLVILLLLPIPGMALEPVTSVIPQPQSQVEITAYTVAYHDRNRESTGGIHHAITFTNKGPKSVVAVQFGLVSFDHFDQLIGVTRGVSIRRTGLNHRGTGTWVDHSPSGFALYQGVAFVHKVRISDGTIWTADLGSVLEQLRAIDPGFQLILVEGQNDPQ